MSEVMRTRRDVVKGLMREEAVVMRSERRKRSIKVRKEVVEGMRGEEEGEMRRG